MLKHYLKISLRFFSKHKLYTLLNLSGLAIGLTAFTLVFLYAQYEMQYDTYHESHQQIYRLKRTAKAPKKYSTNRFRDSIIKIIEESYPEVEQVCRFHVRPGYIQLEKNFFKVAHVVKTQSSFFTLFDHTPLYGDPKSALEDPYSVILTKSVSEKMFGAQNPVGKIITVGVYDKCEMTVKAVIEDLPENSHINANIFVPTNNKHFEYDTISSTDRNGVRKSDLIYYVYLSLKPAVPTIDFLNKLHADFLKRNIAWQKFKFAAGTPDTYELVPLKDIYLSDSAGSDGMKHNNAGKIAILLGISFLILTIAVVNYINLTIARSMVRATEIGIKKTIGAQKIHLIKQILLESVLVCVTASIVALVLVEFLLTPFKQIIQKELSLLSFYLFPNYLIALFFIIFIGLAAGFYPAVYLSKFQPITVLRDTHPKTKKGTRIRNSLITFQFAVSIILIISFIVIYAQLSFINQKSLGFEIDRLLHISLPEAIQQKGPVIRDNLLKHPQISDVSLSMGVPGEKYSVSTIKNLNGLKAECTYVGISPDYFDTFQMEIIQGRNLFPGEKNGRLINESYAKFMDWDRPLEKVIGKNQILGVVKDFHFESLHHPIWPLSFHLEDAYTPDLTVRLASQNIFETMRFIKNTWNELCANENLEYYFYDDHFNQMYQSAENIQRLLSWAAFFAIFVSSLGLVGLSLFTTENRTKEIGIRKALGGSVSNIFLLLSRDYILLIGISNIFAWPVAWFVMNQWLQNFAYRIEITVWPFLLAGLVAVIIALLTVSWQAIRAATANPVEALRYE